MTAVLFAPLALLGATALYLLLGWLACAIIASYLSDRKGYTDKPGLAAGLILYPLGPIIFLLVPAKKDSAWKKQGVFGSKIKDS